GNYDPNRIVQTGLNRPALDLKGAYTYLSLQTGVEVTGALGILLNGRNNITNYQSGIELHFEWALAEHLPFGLMVGVGGYFDQQITDDSGSGDIFGPNRARIASVGPLLSYSFKAEGQQVDVSARWFREFAAQNRPQGDTFITTLAFRL
ncbi:MAG: transporter, partial [Alphaproteobacteria bacterium]|nr:transporter [Alphaproteobacteria bacterium]